MKIFLMSCLISTIVIFFINSIAYAEKNPEVNIIFNGIEAPFSNECIVVDGRIMIPLRSLGDFLNMDVAWSEGSSTATLSYEKDKLIVTEGSHVIRINNREVTSDVTAITVDGRMYLPLRAIAEGLGVYVYWDESTSTATFVPYSQIYGAPSGELKYPKANVTTSQLSDSDKAWLEATLNDAYKKFSKTVARVRGNIIYSTNNGKYDDVGAQYSNAWTDGFYPGILWMMYEKTGDHHYSVYAQRIEDKLADWLNNGVHIEHDLGFLWMYSGYENYINTGNHTSYKNVILAADKLKQRLNSNAGYIVAWNGKPNIAIIDTMMNLDLLYTASKLTGDDSYKNAASMHANSTMKAFIRADGSTQHQVMFDTVNGNTVSTPPGQGYNDGTSNGSHWSRGSSWGIYGFARSYGSTGNINYLNASERIADYFISHLRADGLVPCDFEQPDLKVPTDSSACAIAASGLIDLAKYTGNQKYLDSAIALLKNLTTLCGGDNGDEALLLKACESYSVYREQPLIYGDLYYLEALQKLCSFEFIK